MIQPENHIKTLQDIYMCQSILCIEKYKLETSSFENDVKIQELLNILLHLSMKDYAHTRLIKDQLFLEK